MIVRTGFGVRRSPGGVHRFFVARSSLSFLEHSPFRSVAFVLRSRDSELVEALSAPWPPSDSRSAWGFRRERFPLENSRPDPGEIRSDACHLIVRSACASRPAFPIPRPRLAFSSGILPFFLHPVSSLCSDGAPFLSTTAYALSRFQTDTWPGIIRWRRETSATARVRDRRCRELSARAFYPRIPHSIPFAVIPALLGYDTISPVTSFDPEALANVRN
jgi:hypothetical protein